MALQVGYQGSGSGGGSTSLSGDVTGTTAANQLTGLSAASIPPASDNATGIGTAAKRVASIAAVAVSIFGAVSAANPVATLGVNGLGVGQGGANALSAGFFSSAANTAAIGNATGTAWVNFTSSSAVAQANYAYDGTGTVGVGTSSATAVNLGKSSTTTTVNGPLALANAAVTWGVGVSAPTISQPTQASDAACSSITITPQAPFASAVTNVVGGSIVAQLSAPISGSTEAALIVKRGSTVICQIQAYPGLSNYGAIFLQPGVSIAANSETLAASSSTVILNHGTQVVLGIGGATILACNSTTIVHAVASLAWNATVVAPSITQTAPTAVSSGNGTAGTSFSIAGQTGGATSANSATGGAGSALSITSPGGGNATGTTATGGAAGALNIGTGVPGTGTTAAGAKAPINFQIAGTTYMAISAAGLVTYTNAVTATTATTGTATLPGLVAIFVEESVNGMTYKRALYNV